MDKSFRYKQLDQLLRNEDGYTLNDILVRLGDDISKRTLQREIEKLKQPPYNMQFVNDMYRGREKLIRYKDISKSLYDTHNKKLNKFNEHGKFSGSCSLTVDTYKSLYYSVCAHDCISFLPVYILHSLTSSRFLDLPASHRNPIIYIYSQ